MPMPVFDEEDNLVNLDVDEVYCIYKNEKSRRIIVEARCGEYYLPSTINQIKNIMERSGFLLIDSNRLVNAKHIKGIEGNSVTVDGKTYHVTRSNLKSINDFLHD